MDCSLFTPEAVDDADLTDGLRFLARVAGSLVPSCVGATLTLLVDGQPSTATATSVEVAVLDAAQYLGGGPCLDAATGAERAPVPHVPDEGRWPLYARAAAAGGVRSSLSLPVAGTGGRCAGAVNLYAADASAFEGTADLLAEVFAVPVDDLVNHVDGSSLPPRPAGGTAPDAAVDRAVALLLAVQGWRAGEAGSRLRTAAGEAGVPVERVAGALVTRLAA